MKLRWYEKQVRLIRKLKGGWYGVVKPVAVHFTTTKLNAYYRKKMDKITEAQGLHWVAEDIARYMVRSNASAFKFVLAYSFDNEMYPTHYCLGNLSAYRFLQRNKASLAYYKFRSRVDFQQKVMEALMQYPQFAVEKQIEDFEQGTQVRHYQCTYIVSKINKG